MQIVLGITHIEHKRYADERVKEVQPLLNGAQACCHETPNSEDKDAEEKPVALLAILHQRGNRYLC